MLSSVKKKLSVKTKLLALNAVLIVFAIGTALDVVMLQNLGFAVGGMGSLLACVVAVWCAYRYSGERFTCRSLVLMLKLTKPQVRTRKDALLIGCTTVLLGAVLVYGYSDATTSIDVTKLTLGLISYAVSAAIIPPFIEEMIDRGFIQSAFEKLQYGAVATVLLSASIFSLSHFPTNTESVPITFVFGILAGIITVRTRSVWIPFVLHGVWNFVIAMLIGLS